MNLGTVDVHEYKAGDSFPVEAATLNDKFCFKRKPRRFSNRFVRSASCLFAVAATAITAAIAIPNFIEKQKRNNERTARSSLRTFAIHQNFYAEYSESHCYGTLEELVETSGKYFHGMSFDKELATGVKEGYRFKLTVSKKNPLEYSVTASPIVPGRTGDLYYYIDHTSGSNMRLIRYERGKPAGPSSPRVPGHC
jgi:hypothetical protein